SGRPVQSRRFGRGKNSDQSEILAQGCGQSAQGDGSPRHHRFFYPIAVTVIDVMSRAVALVIVLATAHHSDAGTVADAEALAIVSKHCVVCHAAKPTHESFGEAPKNIILEDLADLKKHAAAIYAQTVQTRAMPLGNQTGMSEDDRAILGHWLKELP